MKNYKRILRIGLILSWIVSCSNFESSANPSFSTSINQEATKPDIPFKEDIAFYPLRKTPDGKIFPSYQWRECTKRFIICLKWETKTVFFENLEWFYQNDFGACKRPTP